MVADLILANVRAYNVEKFDLRLGETCKIKLNATEPTKWFFDNDEVLSITVNKNTARVKALAKGDCEIQFQQGGAIVKRLFASVFDNQATALNITAKEPINK
jgi:hypothetical protein